LTPGRSTYTIRSPWKTTPLCHHPRFLQKRNPQQAKQDEESKEGEASSPGFQLPGVLAFSESMLI
jgi:hypothetical protein